MKGSKHTIEQIISKQREAEVALGEGAAGWRNDRYSEGRLWDNHRPRAAPGRPPNIDGQGLGPLIAAPIFWTRTNPNR